MRYNGGAMRKNEVTSLLQVREVLESLCMELVIHSASDAELAGLSAFLDAIGAARSPEDTAQAVFALHHELAALSGNMLLPLMYHSFRSESLYLWTISCKTGGRAALYDQKLKLYQALLNRDTPEALRLTRLSISNAMAELPSFIS